MGYEVDQVTVTVTKDAHAGEREAHHVVMWCELQWRLEAVVSAGRYDTLRPELTVHQCRRPHDDCEATKRAAKWLHVVGLLAEAQRVVDGEYFGAYVDESSAGDALGEVLDYARWKAFESAGPAAAPGREGLRVIDGEALLFAEFWERQGSTLGVSGE